jgi:Protein of unknown function (DUF1097)
VKRLPAEIVASLLAAITVIIALPPYHLPPWAIFISWAGTFAAGGPKPAVLRKIWPAMPVGATYALAIVLAFQGVLQYFSGWAFTAAQMAIIFSLNTCLMYTGRIPALSFIPGMFFGFASFFATFFGDFGPAPGNPFMAWIATVSMTMLGPAFAWLTARFGSHHADA